MCDDFPPNVLAVDCTQAAAVEAIGLSAFYVGLSSFRVERCDAFDQCPVEFVIEDNDIPNFDAFQKEGEGGDHHEIPFPKVWRHRAASDFVDAKHNKNPAKALRLCSG